MLLFQLGHSRLSFLSTSFHSTSHAAPFTSSHTLHPSHSARLEMPTHTRIAVFPLTVVMFFTTFIRHLQSSMLVMLKRVCISACCTTTCGGWSCQHPAAMADLPRWVDQDDVDSQAMLSAFIRYHYETGLALKQKHGESYQPIWEGQLSAIMHRDPPGIAGVYKARMPMKIPQRPCQKAVCARCTQRRGGFVFRWYSPYWAKYYNFLRRPGAWKAPEPCPVANPSYGEEYLLKQERFWLPMSDLQRVHELSAGLRNLGVV